MKKLIIRWSLKQIKKFLDKNKYSFYELEKYGIADILINEKTGEPMIIID